MPNANGEPIVGDIIAKLEFQAELISVFYQGWLDLKVLWTELPLHLRYDYPCEKCRVFHQNWSKIGVKHHRGASSDK